MDPLFESFFRDFFDPGTLRQQQLTSLGSGVIIDGKRGFILTNNHVISQGGTIKVRLKDKREFVAQIVGADPDSDLAVLRIHTETPLPALPMGDSDDILIGETVIAIGNPFGFSHTVTTGVISATGRAVRTEDQVFQDFIQTDASINPGNSGGPLLNIDGSLIGINTAIYAKAQGIGFAIPINTAKRVVADLIRYGEVIPAWTGITVQAMDARMAHYMQLSGKQGALIKEVDAASPAARQKVRQGDILLAVNALPVTGPEDFELLMRHFKAGDTITLKLWRNGKETDVTLVTRVFPLQRAMDLADRLLGIRVQNLDYLKRFDRRTSATDGVVISEIRSRAYLARIGVQPGDIIHQFDDMPIRNINDFQKAIVKCRLKASVVILLQREDQLYNITAKL
jgi:serine protease Do